MGETPATDADIEMLLAERAIKDKIYRYCRGEDRLDARLSESLWHPDGTAAYGRDMFHGQTASAWAAAVHTNLAKFTGSSHQVGNIIIELDGDRASSEAYVTARVWDIAADGSIRQLVHVGRYLDRWSRRDGVWGVDHRRFVFDLAYATDPVGPPPPDGTSDGRRAPDWCEGRQGPSDPSYDVLGRGDGVFVDWTE